MFGGLENIGSTIGGAINKAQPMINRVGGAANTLSTINAPLQGAPQAAPGGPGFAGVQPPSVSTPGQHGPVGKLFVDMYNKHMAGKTATNAGAGSPDVAGFGLGAGAPGRGSL